MTTFNIKNLIAKHAIIFSSMDSEISIHIFMEPFMYNNEIVSPTIRLDNVDLPSIKLGDLASQSFTFTEDDIEGSIYLNGSHHPVDILSLQFFLGRQNQLTVLVKGIYDFEYEGLDDLSNQKFVFNTQISTCYV